MKVILLKDVRNVGKKDEVKEVSDGYARNFLIPRKMAVASTEANMRQLAENQKEKAAQEARAQAEAEVIAKQLADVTLEFKLNAGANGATFGSVSTKQIAQALAAKGFPVEKRKIMLDVPVDTLGTTKVKADLYKGKVIAVFNVHVSAK